MIERREIEEIAEDEYAPSDHIKCNGHMHQFYYAPSPRSWCMCGAVVFGEIEPLLVATDCIVGGFFHSRRVWTHYQP